MPSEAPTGILIKAGCTLQEVLALRDKAKAELLAGAVKVAEWSSHDTRSRRLFEMSTERLIEECAYALEQLDPETYGQDLIPPYTTAKFY